MASNAPTFEQWQRDAEAIPSKNRRAPGWYIRGPGTNGFVFTWIGGKVACLRYVYRLTFAPHELAD